MAFPLKSGADLYNNQLIRAAIWNYSADIIEPSELVTGLIYFNTSNSSAGKKLRLYTGSAWKTLAFEEDLDVANNAEFKALEDKVKLLAGEVDTDAIISNMKEVSNFLAGFAEDAKLMDVLNNKLDKSGGTITGGLTLSSPNSDYALHFQTGLGAGWIGFQADRERWFVTTRNWSADYTLLHSGNIYEKNLGLNEFSTFRFFTASGDSLAPKNESIISGFTVAIDGNNSFKKQLAFGHDSQPKLYARSQDTGSWSDWKTIAFTDSTVEAANKLVNSNGNALLYTANSNILYDGKGRVLMDYSDDWQVFGEWTGYKTGIRGSSIEMAINGKIATFINSSGNVTIGSSDLAGTSAKLAVKGNSRIYKADDVNSYLDIVVGDVSINYNGYDTDGWSSHYFKSNGTTRLAIIGRNGNVGIGTTDPQHKLHVSEDIVANGTIACKGIAAEGDAMDMVDKVVLHIVPNGNQQTFTLNHGLGTREITISIYEITSMGTNMILTDVEIVNDNSISVSFGNPPTENHMVVVMG